MESLETQTNRNNPVIPSNEYDLKRTEIRCRDDVPLKKLENTSKLIGVLYAAIWAGALVDGIYIIMQRML